MHTLLSTQLDWSPFSVNYHSLMVAYVAYTLHLHRDDDFLSERVCWVSSGHFTYCMHAWRWSNFLGGFLSVG